MNFKMKPLLVLIALATTGSLMSCAQMKMGDAGAKTTATGSAGGANAQNANAQLEHCDKPLGTIAVVEDQNALIAHWRFVHLHPQQNQLLWF